MKNWLRRWWWPIAKWALAGAILVGVGRRFYLDLHKLDWEELTVQPFWLAMSAFLYVVGLGFSGIFWHLLLEEVGEKPRRLVSMRAYYLGHLGKYLPGKAWALLVRGMVARGPNVRLGVAVVTGFYEVLTTMAAGA